MWPFNRKPFAERVKEVVTPIIRAYLQANFTKLYVQTSGEISAAFAEYAKKHGNIIGIEVDGTRRGYVIVLTKLNGQDIVRVIPIDRDVDAKAFNQLVRWAQMYLGYSVDFTDIPVQLVKELKANSAPPAH